MFNKITIILLSVFCITACGKKCKDAADNARTKPKNPTLMYIWRYTDNLIAKKSTTTDSGFISFKPNGDFITGENLKDLNTVPDVWYLNNNIIVKSYCGDNVPNEANVAKYSLRNDTLFLNFYSDVKVQPIAKTYIHYRKY